MKRNSYAVLWIALALIAAGAVLITLSLLGGANLRELWNSGAFSLHDANLGAGAGYQTCESGTERFSPDEVRRIDLGWVSGKVTLESGRGDQIELTERASRTLKDGEKLRWKLENGTLFVRYCENGMRNLPEKELTLTVPADWTAEWIDLGVTSGDVTLRSIRVSDQLELTATSGDMRAESCSAGRIEAEATSGSLALLDCVCRTLEAETTSGAVQVRCEAEKMSLSATSGTIYCEDVPARCDVECSTTSGEVFMRLSDTRDGQRIEIETTSGDVHLDAPGAIELDYDTASGDLRGSLRQGGKGCPRVEVETTSGDLILGSE